MSAKVHHKTHEVLTTFQTYLARKRWLTYTYVIICIWTYKHDMNSIRTLYFRHSVITLAPHWSQSCWYHVGIFHLPFLHPYHRSSISFDASSPRTTRSSSSAPAKSMARSAAKLRKVGKADLRQTNRCHWSSRLALGLADFVPLPLLPVESTWQCLGVSNLDRPLLAALPVCRPCESHAHRVNPINTINSRISYKYCDQWRKISRCSSCAKLHVDIWGSKPRKTSFVYLHCRTWG